MSHNIQITTSGILLWIMFAIYILLICVIANQEKQFIIQEPKQQVVVSKEPKTKAVPRIRVCPNIGVWKSNKFIYSPQSIDTPTCVRQMLSGYKTNRVVFIGDSTMRRTSVAAAKGCRTVRSANGRCGLMEYLSIKRDTTWKPPTDLSRGPVHFGRKNPYCTDCGHCTSGLYRCKNGKQIEYISMEFGRDIELQSKLVDSTQQAVALYLLSTPADLCIVNTGIHDIVLNVNAATYANYVHDYLVDFKRSCSNIIWLSISKTKNEKEHKQRNEEIIVWNDHILKMVLQRFADIGYIDVYNMSSRMDMHTDNVHLITNYYTTIANWFTTQYNADNYEY